MLDQPFRGSSSGLSPGLLRRARAAAVLVQGRGVVAGWAAAELLDASCGGLDAPVDVIVPGGSMRSRAGLVVHADLLDTDEVTAVATVPVTTPLLTAFHLACRPPVVEAIVAVDALAHAHGFAPEAVLWMGRRHLGARGSGQLREVVRRADRLADSPMETRIRVAIEDAGLVVPVLQHPVGPYRLDMAYPGIKIGIEYDGREHRTQRRAMHDLRREAYLTAAGWEILRFTDAEVLGKPRWVAGTVRWALVRAAHARGLPPR